jgi:DNA-binding response OmpR family regulator
MQNAALRRRFLLSYWRLKRHGLDEHSGRMRNINGFADHTGSSGNLRSLAGCYATETVDVSLTEVARFSGHHTGDSVMASGRPRALVVDDETVIRKLVTRALREQGFECEEAVDGDQAACLAARSRFDVVITDLKMPNKNGHVVALEMLAKVDRPLVVVYTAIDEPILVKDLLARGVDDIVFKPTNVASLAAKVKGLVERWPRRTDEVQHQHKPTHCLVHEASTDAPLSLSELNAKLAELSTILPVSSATLDVYEMTRSDDWQISQIAAAIQRDASLVTEVLRLSNSSAYNPSGRKIACLEEAVVRIGQKRVGELALVANALAGLTPRMLPWMNLEFVWKRSMAAGIAMESLIEVGDHQEVEQGLMLSAIMHPLGRIVLGMLLPKRYEAMLRTCAERRESLREQERRLLPTNHTTIMAQLLASWRIPPEVSLPLKFALDDFSTLSRFSEPTRTRTELVKVAITLGRLAADCWETWDLVEFPPPRVLNRLRICDVGQIVRQTRSDLSKLAAFHPSGVAAKQETSPHSTTQDVSYCNPLENDLDLLVELLRSMGIQPRAVGIDELRCLEQPSIVNCFGADSARFAANGDWKHSLFVTDEEHSDSFKTFSRVATLPNSYGCFRDALFAIVAEGALEDVNKLCRA